MVTRNRCPAARRAFEDPVPCPGLGAEGSPRERRRGGGEGLPPRGQLERPSGLCASAGRPRGAHALWIDELTCREGSFPLPSEPWGLRSQGIGVPTGCLRWHPLPLLSSGSWKQQEKEWKELKTHYNPHIKKKKKKKPTIFQAVIMRFTFT